MWLRCAFVRRTLGSAGVALPSSCDDEQPARTSTASAAMIARWRTSLARIGGARQIRAMPPAAAERLEQCRGVGEAIRLGLNQAEPRLLIRLVGVEHREVGRIAVLVLEAGDIEAGLRRVGGLRGRLQRLCILFERDQRVGDILECSQDRAAILLGALLIGVAGGPFLVQLRAAIEDRRKQRRSKAPEGRTW